MSLKQKFLKPNDANFNEDRADTDSAGSNTSFVYNSFINQSIDKQRQKLPVFNVRNHFLYLVENHQTIMVTGETGSGKSTQIPQYLLEAKWDEDGIIGVVEPRRVAATSLASRVSDEKSVLLGNEIGYSIRFDDCTSVNTKLKYMTEGILVREMMADPLLRQYCVIMLDEVHERTLYTDVILGLMKKILKKRKHLRLVVCSATFDADYFLRFFNFNKTDDRSLDTAALLEITGRTYPVEINYLKEPAPDYVKACVETVIKINRTQAHGDILVFLTGAEEVNLCIEMIQDEIQKATTGKEELYPMPMHGSLPNSDQLRVFQPLPGRGRKVIVATNIAETSVTIPEIVYVIDCGFVKMRFYNPSTYADCLSVVPVSKAAAIQRAGRAGRTRSGKVFRLYEEIQFDHLIEATPPEMMRTNLSPAILHLLALGIENILRFDFPCLPPAKNLISSLEELIALKAVNEDGHLTKPLGQQLAEVPLPPAVAKFLLVSGEYGCSEEIISIVSMLQVKDVFISVYRERAQSKIMHRKFQVAEGDLITLLNVYTAFEKSGVSKRWCAQNYINYKALKRAKELRDRMLKMITTFNITLNSSEGAVDPICKCITAGLFVNAAYLHYSGDYKMLRGNQCIHIHPSSVLYYEKQPQWVVFAELIHTNRVYMKDLTVIDKSWLTSIAPHFYENATLN